MNTTRIKPEPKFLSRVRRSYFPLRISNHLCKIWWQFSNGILYAYENIPKT